MATESPGGPPQGTPDPAAGPQSPGGGPQSPGAGYPQGGAVQPAYSGPAPQQYAQSAVGPRANFGQRFGAYLIDAILLAIVNVILMQILGGAGQALSILIGLGYFAYFEGSPSGQTVGKKALNIRVIDFDTGGPIGIGRALLRYLARILSAIPLLLGYFWMLWDGQKQTWHDKLATTVVVPTSAYPVEKWPG